MAFSIVLTILSLAILTLAQKSIDIYAWPVNAASPISTPYASISYTSTSPNGTLTNFNRDLSLPQDSTLIRLGYYTSAAKTKQSWTGIAVPASNFQSNTEKTLRLWVDGAENVYGLNFAGVVPATPTKVPKGKKAKKDKKKKAEPVEQVKREELVVEVVRQVAGPKPVLNRPVVLNAEGKVDEKTEEKSFLQK